MRQSHKMVKYTQTIRQQQPTNCLSIFEHFVGLALKGFMSKKAAKSEAYSEPSQTSKIEFFAKILNIFHTLTIFAKKQQPRYLTGFWIYL